MIPNWRSRPIRDRPSNRGAASVEQIGLICLVAIVVLAVAATLIARPPEQAAPDLARAIARKLRCAPRLPDNCWHDPLTEAYGRRRAGAVRALAPLPATRDGLLPVDFRGCRGPGCARPGAAPGLTASNRRVTGFVTVREATGAIAIDYWLYRPGQPWELVTRVASAAQVTALASTPLLESDVPVLVPLETLAGRNHVKFSAVEEPPWRWQVG